MRKLTRDFPQVLAQDAETGAVFCGCTKVNVSGIDCRDECGIVCVQVEVGDPDLPEFGRTTVEIVGPCAGVFRFQGFDFQYVFAGNDGQDAVLRLCDAEALSAGGYCRQIEMV